MGAPFFTPETGYYMLNTLSEKDARYISQSESEKIEHLLAKINNELKEKSRVIKDPALMSGTPGILLFLCYYRRFEQTTENDTAIENILGNVFESLQSDKNLGYHLASGLTGIFWTIRHLVNQKLLDNSILDGLSDVEDQFLEEFITFENSRSNYDLFYGTLGAGLLLLEREEKSTVLLTSIFQGLDQMKKEFFYGDGYQDPMPAIRRDKNEDFEGDGIKEIYNLGMAHGSPSVMVFLSLLAESDIVSKSRLTEILNRIGGFMSYHQMNPDEGSLHPIWFHPKNPDPFPSRLSWCYGDLSIACGYAAIGQKMNNNGFIKSAEKIGQLTLDKDTMPKAKLFDACLCHGSAGNMHMYRRLYEYTGNQKFADAERRWSEIGLSIHEQTKGNSIFSYFDAEEFKPDFSFLEGLAGTGLAYIARIDKNNPAWDRLLLLS